MTTNELIKEIRGESWWSEEAPAVPLFCMWMQEFVHQSKYGHPKLPNIIFCFIKKDFVYEETPESQKLKIWHYVWRQYLRLPSIQHSRYRLWQKIVKELAQEGNNFIGQKRTMSDHQLAKSLECFSFLVKEHWRITWVHESADVFTTEELPLLLIKDLPHISADKLNDLAFTLAAPHQHSFMEEAHQDLLKLVIKWYSVIRKSPSLGKAGSSLQSAVADYTEHYIWLHSNYRAGVSLSKDYVWRELKRKCKAQSKHQLRQDLNKLITKVARIKAAQVELYRSIGLSDKFKKAFQLLSFWSAWTDERKRAALIADWYLEAYAKEIAKRLGMSIWQVKYLTAPEAITALLGGKRPGVGELKKRRRLALFLTVKSGSRVIDQVITGRKAQILWRAMFPPKKSSQIKGQVAWAPVKQIQGVVQIVFNPHTEKFKKGRILVTTMTRPDFVPIMRKAKAIICDEGGITSHAAIISRELGIPCIIGTKNATKVLKNGNYIKIDVKNGIIKKVK